MKAKFYEPKYKDGKILAFADVEMDGGIIIRGFRVVDGVNGVFASVPQKAITVEDQTKYVKQVVFDNSEHREAFMTKLLADYEAWSQSSAAQASTA